MRSLFVILFLVAAHFTSAQTMNFWTKKSDFGGLKRERAASFSLNNKGYVCTGVDTNEVVHKDLWEYDATTDTWTQKANFPGTVRRDASSFVIDNKGYLVAGMDSSNAVNGHTLKDLWMYDPMSNTWTQKADYPGSGNNGIYFSTAFSLDGKGYLCCGKTGAATYSKEIWEYKPLNNSWTQRGNFPGGLRYQLCSFVIDDHAYMGLGADQNIYRKDIWQYDPGSDTWIQKADFAGGERGSATTFTLGQRGFICLGTDGGLKNDLWEYDPFLDTWTARASYGGSSRKDAMSFVCGNRAYVGTGTGYSGKKMSVYEYTPMDVLSVNDVSEETAVNIFPNLVSDHFFVQCPAAETILLYDISGTRCAVISAEDSGTTTIERKDLRAGMYFVVIITHTGELLGNQKMILL